MLLTIRNNCFMKNTYSNNSKGGYSYICSKVNDRFVQRRILLSVMSRQTNKARLKKRLGSKRAGFSYSIMRRGSWRWNIRSAPFTICWN